MFRKYFYIYGIFACILIFFSFYIIYSFFYRKTEQFKLRQTFNEYIDKTKAYYDYCIYVPDFHKTLSIVSGASPLLFEKKSGSFHPKIIYFQQLTDKAMSGAESWKKIFHSPAYIFLSVQQDTISDVLIIFENTEHSAPLLFPDNHMVFYEFRTDGPAFFHCLSSPNSIKPFKKRNYGSKSSPDISKRKDGIYLIANKNLMALLTALGFELNLEQMEHSLPGFFLVELSNNHFKINSRIQSVGFLKSSDHFRIVLSPDSLFSCGNSRMASADTLSGFSIVRALENSFEKKKFYLYYEKIFSVLAELKDIESYSVCMQYLRKLYPARGNFVFLPPEVFRKKIFSDTIVMGVTVDDFVLITEKKHYPLVMKSVQSDFPELVRAISLGFPDDIVLGMYSKKIIYENFADTASSALERKCRTYLNPQNDFFVNMEWQKLNPNDPDWTFHCDTTVAAGPFRFLNHNTGDAECIVQDYSKKIYILTMKASPMHTFFIKNFIGGQLFMTDIFKNKKIQMLFESNHQLLHLIDRNGKYVNAYPFALPSRITTPINVILYPQSEEQRVWFGCRDKKIYSYTLFTLRPDKFVPYRSDYICTLPVRYVSFKNSDYLFTIDVEGNIHAFGRKGDPRVGFRNKAIKNLTDFVLGQKNKFENSFVLYFDKNDRALHKVYLTDTKEIIPLPDIESDVGCYAFLEGINPILAVSTDKYIHIFNENGNKLYSIPSPFHADSILLTNTRKGLLISVLNKSMKKHFVYLNQKPLRRIELAENGNVIYDENQNRYYYVVTNGRMVSGYWLKF